MTIRVLLVDDHPIVRAGIRGLIDAQGDMRVVGEADSGESAIALLDGAEESVEVALCDLRLGAGMDGVELTAALRSRTLPPAVVILTTYDRDADILGAVEAGAAGYLRKDASTNAIVSAVRDAAAGRVVYTPQIAERVSEARRLPRIEPTERERDVLLALETGGSNRQIARDLFISEATVKTHLVHLFAKLGVENRTQALAVARERGLLPPHREN